MAGIKWIVTDMDGTLLNSQDHILDRTFSCLMKCQKAGVKLILASGRSYARLMPYVEQLEMKKYGGSLIEVNGMAVNSLADGSRTVFCRLQQADRDRLFPFVEKREAEIQCYEDEAVYYWIPERIMEIKRRERKRLGVPESFQWMSSAWSFVAEESHTYPIVKQVYSMEEMPKVLNKLNCTDDPERIDVLYRELKHEFGDAYEYTRTCPRLIEIAPAGITKGQALKKYMQAQGVLPEEVVVFGDGENDVDMFAQVSWSVAMGNSADYVKEQAAFVTLDHDCDGIAEFLENLPGLEQILKS